jgi:hypothetical protein
MPGLLELISKRLSGVSTLLKTIAGKTHGLSVSNQANFNYQGTISTASQLDMFLY